jgi:hypothetical protein
VHKANLLIFSLGFMTFAALAATPRDTEALSLAHRQQLEFRQGNLEIAKPLVKSLEEAVAKSSDNAQLWEALGSAYMSLQGAMSAGPPDLPKLLEVGERARDAYARALALKAASPMARAGHGMATMLVALMKNDGPGIVAGVDEMNAAVRDAPKSKGTRLTRAFTIIHLPHGLRDNTAVIEDLRFMIDTVPGSRPEDVMRVLLGPPRRRDARLARRRVRGGWRSQIRTRRIRTGLGRLGLCRRTGEGAPRRSRKGRGPRGVDRGRAIRAGPALRHVPRARH